MSMGVFMPLVGAIPRDYVLIPRTEGTQIGNFNNRAANIFDGITYQLDTQAAKVAGVPASWAGKSFASPRVFARAIAYGSYNHGFQMNVSPTITLSVYGKNGTTPSHSSDGTLLGSITFQDQNDESGGRVIESTDLSNEWDHIWLEIYRGTNAEHVLAELVLYEWA